ncbi:peptidoglycan DD-metalloendopeptidase family protein [bacterium]|nr:peptidoglycan DD-metalloendopeptidase family protein [bacterium]
MAKNILFFILILLSTVAFSDKESLLKEIQDFDMQIVNTQKEIVKAQKEIKNIENQLFINKKVLEKLSREQEDKKRVLQNRLKFYYKLQNRRKYLLFFDSSNISEMELKGRFLKKVIDYDFKLLKEYLLSVAKTKGALLKQEDIYKDLQQKQGEFQNEKASLEKQRDDKKRLLQTILTSEKLKIKVQKEQDSVSKSINKKVSSSKSTNDKNSPFLKKKGKLSLPTKGKVSRWYQVKYDKKTNTYDVHKGLTMSVPKKTDVYAVDDGKIVYQDYIKGYGNTIIISHGDNYYSLYMHLDEFLKKTGDSVVESEKIALSGETGNAEKPKLYFEIRYKKEPININSWFKK